MKNALPKPLMRMATAHTSAVVGNTKPSQSSSYPALPLLASGPLSPSYSPTPYSTTTIVAPRINNFTGIRNFSSNVHNGSFTNKRVLPLGTLALLGGVMLFLGNSTAQALAVPFFSRGPTPASRMKERLEKHGFIEKVVVPDGNCQMRALADQIHGDEKYHSDVRAKIATWLSNNEKFQIDDSGHATLGDFVDKDVYPRWASYVAHMARNGAWGDHITLVAASEVYGIRIAIISNIDDNGTGQYITNIVPRTRKPTKTVNLSHWHEQHYNSLYPTSKQVGGREL